MPFKLISPASVSIRQRFTRLHHDIKAAIITAAIIAVTCAIMWLQSPHSARFWEALHAIHP